MSIPADTVWAVTDTTTDATASDNNGGGFSTAQKGATGVDKTNGAGLAITTFTSDLSAVGTTSLTSAGALFTNTMLGNVINIAGQGLYCIQGFTSTSVVTVDRALGTFAATTGVVGGALNTPGKALSVAVGGNIVQCVGSGSISSASNNVAGGCLSLPAGSTTAPTQVLGSLATRGDGGRYTLTAGNAISTFKMITYPTISACYVAGIIFDGANLTSSRGIDATASSSVLGTIYNCKFSRFTNGAIVGQSSFEAIGCEVTACSTVAAVQNCCTLGCFIHDNTFTGYTTSVSATVKDTFSVNNTGVSSDGFAVTGTTFCTFEHCDSFGNGRDNWRITASAGNVNLTNCYSEAPVGWCYNATAADANVRLLFCGGKGANLVNANITTATIGFVTCTVSAYVNTTTDFSKNNTANGGALLRGAGFPSLFPGSSTSSYRDIGASQTRSVGPLGAVVMGIGQAIIE